MDTTLRTNTIPAEEIGAKGLAAVDTALDRGPVHVTVDGQPRYVVMTERQYDDLVDTFQDAYISRVNASLEDVAAGRVYEFESTEAMMEAILNYEDDTEE